MKFRCVFDGRSGQEIGLAIMDEVRETSGKQIPISDFPDYTDDRPEITIELTEEEARSMPAWFDRENEVTFHDQSLVTKFTAKPAEVGISVVYEVDKEATIKSLQKKYTQNHGG